MTIVPEGSAQAGWPVLVTGAGGFVGGHVARTLAGAGYRVRGFVRRPPRTEPGDPPIDWLVGDLREVRDRERAVAGVRGVVHTAGWVSLGADPRGDSHAMNVEATRALLDAAARMGVERFLYTSTLWTVAAGTADEPADEASAWNLERIRSPYCQTKRKAERLVLDRAGPEFHTAVICPGLVIGPRDVRPTSTRVLLAMARKRFLVIPRGGIPVVDAGVLALAHMRALQCAEAGGRYVVAGPYLSYAEMARLVARVAGRPRSILHFPDLSERGLTAIARRLDSWSRGRFADVSAAGVAGGFLRLHVTGARADAAFGLRHPRPLGSIFEALDDHRRSGRAPWLRLKEPADSET